MANIAIVGSRTFADMERVRILVRELPPESVIISGGARGVDSVAEEEARKRGMEVRVFRPDWKAHGRAAGPIRNRLIIEAADEVWAFWDGQSRGTKSSIDLARSAGKVLRVVEVK